MASPDKDDNTAAYPTYLPVPVLVAWDITTSTSAVNDEQKPQAVRYAFLAPRHKTTTGDASTMERFLFPDYSGMHIGSSLLAMLLMLVQWECGLIVFKWVVTEANGYVQYLQHANKVRRVVAAVSIDTDASEGGEWLPRWLESKGFWEAMRVRDLAVGGGKWVDTAYLWFDVPVDAGDGGDFSSADDGGYGGGHGDGEGSEVGSVESEASVGSERSAASYDSYGSEGSQGSQASHTSVSNAENDHGSDDEQQDSEEEEEDWDDDDDPYGEVEDDDIEFD